jgi:hypothetical protein
LLNAFMWQISFWILQTQKGKRQRRILLSCSSHSQERGHWQWPIVYPNKWGNPSWWRETTERCDRLLLCRRLLGRSGKAFQRRGPLDRRRCLWEDVVETSDFGVATVTLSL